jgi:large subunit ribosomal protein L35
MPKMKTHSGAKKRFKITGTGKVMAEHAGKRHLLEVKPSKRTRRQSGRGELDPVEAKRMKKLLGL